MLNKLTLLSIKKQHKVEIARLENIIDNYESALRVISKKQPGLVDEAFSEIGEEEK